MTTKKNAKLPSRVDNDNAAVITDKHFFLLGVGSFIRVIISNEQMQLFQIKQYFSRNFGLKNLFVHFELTL